MMGSGVETTEQGFSAFGEWCPHKDPGRTHPKVMVSGLGPQEQVLGVTIGKALLLHPDQGRHSRWTGEIPVV